jgi:hypothetical protein
MSRSEKRNRVLQIKVRVDATEKALLQNRAKSCGVSTASFLRDLALAYPLTSVVDQHALDELIKARADLGRLGGLFKLWLTKNEDHKESAKLGKYDYKTVENLVEEIESRQIKLLEIAEKLL